MYVFRKRLGTLCMVKMGEMRDALADLRASAD